MEKTPAWFLVSSQRISGEPKNPKESCINSPFLL
jgi:hypothetical protein